MRGDDLGELRDRVTILSAGESTNSHGATVLNWSSPTTIATVWANVNGAGGAEELETGKVTAVVTYEVEIRYRADVTPKMRLSWTPFRGSARTLEIHAVLPKDGRRERLVLRCGEVAS